MGGQGFSSFLPAPRLEGEPPLPALGLREPRAEQLHWAQGQEQRAGCLQGTEAPRRCCPAREAAGPGRGLWDLLCGGDRVPRGTQHSPEGPRAPAEKVCRTCSMEGTAYYTVHSTAQEGHGPWWRRAHGIHSVAGTTCHAAHSTAREAAGTGSQEDAHHCGDLQGTHTPGSFKYQPEEVPACVLVLCVAISSASGTGWQVPSWDQ